MQTKTKKKLNNNTYFTRSKQQFVYSFLSFHTKHKMQDNYISTLQAVQFYWEVYVFYYQSDVGLDDIQVRLGTCKSSLPSNPATTSSPQLVVWTTKNRPIGSKTTEKVTSSTTTKGTVPTMQPQVFSSEIGLNYKITSKCSFKMLLIV